MKPQVSDCLNFADGAAWRAWLETNHATVREAWLIQVRKGSDRPGLGLEAAKDEALCYGWIDSTLHPVDDEVYALRYSPRRPKSIWAQATKRRALWLVREGRMAPAGLAAIAEAKRNGEWAAAAAREDVITLPPDLARALRAGRALKAFKSRPFSWKKQRLYWLSTARRPETRQRRLQAIVEMALAGRPN
jgi:uncharacterized protein YdeI (YjbR/CyaY-like superfamily)